MKPSPCDSRTYQKGHQMAQQIKISPNIKPISLRVTNWFRLFCIINFNHITSGNFAINSVICLSVTFVYCKNTKNSSASTSREKRKWEVIKSVCLHVFCIRDRFNFRSIIRFACNARHSVMKLRSTLYSFNLITRVYGWKKWPGSNAWRLLFKLILAMPPTLFSLHKKDGFLTINLVHIGL